MPSCERWRTGREGNCEEDSAQSVGYFRRPGKSFPRRVFRLPLRNMPGRPSDQPLGCRFLGFSGVAPWS